MKRLALLLLVSACGGEPVDVCAEMSPGPVRAAEIGTYDDNGNFVAYVDGDEASLILGLQGGYMVTPVIRIPAEADDEPRPCFNVVVENELDPPGSAPDLEFATISVAEDGMYELNGILNFLGNLRRDLLGRTLTMNIEVLANGFTVEETIQVVLAPDA